MPVRRSVPTPVSWVSVRVKFTSPCSTSRSLPGPPFRVSLPAPLLRVSLPATTVEDVVAGGAGEGVVAGGAGAS